MDKQLLQEYYERITDQEVINIITNDGKALTPEATELIELEVKKRQLNPEILQFLVPEENNEIPVPTIFTAEGCPVDEPVRIWLEAAFQKLLNMFGEENTQTRSVLIPERIHFPVKFDGSEKSAFDTLKIVAAQMEVSNEIISLDFYDDHYRKITPNSPAGLYHGKNDDGIFEISIVRSLLDTPEELIAVLAHEIAHIKLLGENRLVDNDEPLTDLTTVFFGLGVFNANAAFQTFADAKYYGWSRTGYLTQIEWGYALALFAAIRDEENPVWVSYLNKSVGAYFKRGLDFIANNPEMIFQEIEE